MTPRLGLVRMAGTLLAPLAPLLYPSDIPPQGCGYLQMCFVSNVNIRCLGTELRLRKFALSEFGFAHDESSDINLD